MKIEAVIIFPNIKSIFHTKSRYPREKIGWATTVWTLINEGGLYWETDIASAIYTLSLERKKRFATKLAKELDCKIIYLDKKRAFNSIKYRRGNYSLFHKIPFREYDIK